jgi:hypothetical protein
VATYKSSTICFAAVILAGLAPNQARAADVGSRAEGRGTFGLDGGILSQSDRPQTDFQPKSAAPSVLARNTPYAVAREYLLREGWQPASTSDADKCEGGDTRCEGRPEMQACAGTGEANCLFLWKRNTTVIVVTTFADPPLVSAVECRSDCR